MTAPAGDPSSGGNFMTDSSKPKPRLLLGILFGLMAGAGAVIAHYNAVFDPLYHKLGWHGLMTGQGHPPQGDDATAAGHGGHAGHGGMGKPQAKGEPSNVPGYSIVTLTPEKIQLIGVKTGTVFKDALRMSIRTVGIIEPDQTRLKKIQTRVSGFVTKVHVNFVGQEVKKGDPLVEIYSPDLLSTQEEYLIALEAWETGGKTAAQLKLMELARRRLELWGVSQEEIKTLAKTKKAQQTLTLRAPLSGKVLDRNVLQGSTVEPTTVLYLIADLSVLWLQARVYEYELPHVELGQPVEVHFLSLPGTIVSGKVSFVEPVLQEATRTVKVRVPIDNPKGKFMPGMYADLKIEHDMGTGHLIPDSAVLRTGERDIAFRVLGGGKFESVEVKLGSLFGNRYEVLSGLAEGDEVVTSAVFLIDAESRLKAALSDFGGHQHGSGGDGKMDNKPANKPKDHKGGEHQHHH
jgi:Cu(I)/Ag(I) efflux system membrane fusion protein